MSWVIFLHTEDNFALMSNFMMMGSKHIFMDQAAQQRSKLKRIWTKFVKLEMSDQLER